ncbi:MAG TPA: Zn-ribbon domain-containing OB-fold protein [Acidimicrobiales bacterium]|nr:Zn-ribbon domain-containing OB-fold protein [Acidimicrobiales bacterium]
MTDSTAPADDRIPWDDPVTRPFWEAALERRLVVQRCGQCGTHQFYPRPFCLECQSDDIAFVDSPGRGTVYSRTRVHIPLVRELEPPYTVVLVDLDEGVRLTGNLVGDDCRIGDRVRATWRERSASGLPPLPVFELDT